MKKRQTYSTNFFLVFTECPCGISKLPESNSLLPDLTIYLNEVFDVLNTLQTTKALWGRQHQSVSFKNCTASLVQPLQFLFSLSLNKGKVPSEWKHHKIIPVFKTRDKSCVNNYRPISLLSTTSKILERLVCNKVMEVYSDSISLNQFGFCKNKSTLHQLLLYFNDLCSSKGQKDCIYLDFSKVEAVAHWDHWKLWTWFHSYLTFHYQCVSVNGCLSNVLPVKSGVP